LIKNAEESEESIYETLLKPANIFSKKAMEKMAGVYSYDKRFLKETQEVLKKYKSPKVEPVDFDKVHTVWEEVKNDKRFKEHYNYVTWSMFEFANSNDYVLQYMSLLTIVSPILSLFLPVFILLIPFLIIKMKGATITCGEYYKVILSLLKNHSVGRILTSFNTADLNKKVYLIISLGFYLLSIYQNFNTCIRFSRNMKKIHEYLFLMKDYKRFINVVKSRII
jgi:hypothetical protein